jgi:hypothetical protein
MDFIQMSVNGDRSKMKVYVNAVIKLSLLHYYSPGVMCTNVIVNQIPLYKI